MRFNVAIIYLFIFDFFSSLCWKKKAFDLAYENVLTVLTFTKGKKCSLPDWCVVAGPIECVCVCVSPVAEEEKEQKE